LPFCGSLAPGVARRGLKTTGSQSWSQITRPEKAFVPGSNKGGNDEEDKFYENCQLFGYLCGGHCCGSDCTGRAGRGDDRIQLQPGEQGSWAAQRL
jgi:hypothetical protein